MATQLTEADITTFVTDILDKEGARPKRGLYRRLGNQALAIVSEEAKPYHTYWDNSDGGDLTLSDNTAALPIDCLHVESVEWDGDDNPLIKSSALELDIDQPGWRSDTGEPDRWVDTGKEIILNSIPSGTTTGKLVARGVAILPEFSDVEEATNPLTYLPTRFQLMPAYYILAHIAPVPAVPSDGSEHAARAAERETQRRVAVRQQYAAMWDDELSALRGTVGRRQREPFAY